MANDYERRNAGEWGHQSAMPASPVEVTKWQLVRNPNRMRGPRRPPDLPIKLVDDSDNEGERAARNNEEPRDHVFVPAELLHFAEHDPRNLARDEGTFLHPVHRQHASDAFCFTIYGEKDAVARTKLAINSWISTHKPSKTQLGTTPFAKQASLTDSNRRRMEKRWERDVRRFKYRKQPLPGSVFEAIGSFQWPVEDCDPFDALGPNLEALDPLRMDESCFIVWHKEDALFKAFGRAEGVQNCLRRIRMVFFQIVARQSITHRAYLLRWANLTDMPSHICFAAHPYPAIVTPVRAEQSEPGLTPIPIEGSNTGLDVSHDAQTASAPYHEHIQASLLQVLPRLHYYRGHLQLRVRLGTFLATRFRKAEDGRYTVSDFTSMLSQSQFDGHVTPHVGDQAAESNLLTRMQCAHDLLIPRDHRVERLEDVMPTYAAVFLFDDLPGPLRLSVEWCGAVEPGREHNTMELVSRKWIRLNQDASFSSLLDISLIDIQQRQAWQFDLIGAQTIDETRLPRDLIDFPEHIRIDSAIAHNTGASELFVQFPPSARLRSLQQRIIYRYDLKPVHTDYTIEISRDQTRILLQDTPGANLLGKCRHKIFEGRWAVQVYRNEWDKNFSGNEVLAIGAGTSWADSIAAWFPDEGDCSGFEVLLNKLQLVESLVKAPVEDLMTGMTVG